MAIKFSKFLGKTIKARNTVNPDYTYLNLGEQFKIKTKIR